LFIRATNRNSKSAGWPVVRRAAVLAWDDLVRWPLQRSCGAAGFCREHRRRLSRRLSDGSQAPL